MTRRRARARGLPVRSLLVAAALGACSYRLEVPACKIRCASDKECPADYVCATGFCRPPDQTRLACPPAGDAGGGGAGADGGGAGDSGRAGADAAGDAGASAATADPNRACGAMTCPDGQACCHPPLTCAGMCRPDCRRGSPCTGAVPFCNPRTGVCEPTNMTPPRGACSSAAACGAGDICCVDARWCGGGCVRDCRPTGKCAFTFSCNPASGECVETECRGGCPGGQVCCRPPNPCGAAGARCVADCRSPGAPPCDPGTICSAETGVCQAPFVGGGAACQSGEACAPGFVCCQGQFPCAGMCVEDCRVTGRCPPNAPRCNAMTGWCE